MTRPIKYPTTPRQETIEILHGKSVQDPYRFLEDDHSPETKTWVDAQNNLTGSYLESLPSREHFKKRLTELWDYEQYGVPFKKGDRWFYTFNPGLDNQASLYCLDVLDGSPRLLLNPNDLSTDGTVALTGTFVDNSGNYLAYSLSEAGSDWQEWHVRQVDDGEDLPDKIAWSKFSGASWSSDSLGFYYSRYDEPQEGFAYKEANRFQKIYYHRLGTSQSDDHLIYERPDQEEWGLEGSVSEDGRYLIITVWRGTFQENGVFFSDLSKPNTPVVELLRDFDASYTFLGNDGSQFYFHTNHSAPHNRIIAVNTESSGPASWQEIVPETGDTLESASIVGSCLILIYLHDASHLVKVFDLKGVLKDTIALPGIGSVEGFYGSREDQNTFFKFSSFTQPGTIFLYDLNSGKSTVFRQPVLKFNPDDYITEQVFYPSKDGTRIPMFLVHKKDFVRDGQNMTYLYGYGGFNISLPPSFRPARIGWLDSGGLFAQPNLRGGGEYGKAWHDAGKLHNKQNVFDDFIAAAEWLIINRYTSTTRLAIHGGSNGGLLTGACLTQRPDLYGAVVASVGVLDMLRFHKWTIGWAWVSDYGSPDDPADFDYLLGYSPYHNIQPGTAYPPTLITTGDHDDRVFPAHSFKFAAQLQAAQAGPAPVLIRIETRAGHGAGKPTSMQVEEMADIFAFMMKALGG